MASFNTDQYNLQKATRANTSRNAPENITGGEVEYAVIPYTLATTEAATDTINLCVLPAGSIPIPQLSSITCAGDPGTALTLDIGTAANTDGWGDAIAMTVGGKVDFCAAANTQPAWAVQTPLVADTGSGNAVVYATVDTATSLNAVALSIVLAYKRGR